MSRNQAADKKKLLQLLINTPIVEVACTQANVPRTTYYRWRRQDEKFAEACDAALEESTERINDLAESQLITAIKEQNMTAIIFWLKHHHQIYETRIKVDANLKHDPEALTPEQAMVVEQALLRAGLLQTNVQVGQDDGK
jgi:hypothetical protein